MMKNAFAILLSAFALALIACNAQAGTRKAISGVLACGGNQLIRYGGSEFHKTNYVLRNYNALESIDIDRIRVYDATGNLISDFPGTALPRFTNKVLGPTDNSLQPMQTAQFGTEAFFGDSGLAKTARPLQVLIDWSAATLVKPLSASSVRVVRERIVSSDALGNPVVQQGTERSRHQARCRAIEVIRN